MRMLALVDSPNAIVRAMRDCPGARIVTDNPLLAAAEPLAENIDALVPQERAFELGRNALAITALVERRLAGGGASQHLGLPSGSLGVTGPFSRLVASVLHRAAAMARAVKTFAPEKVVLLLIDTPPWDPRQPLMMPRFANPARQLAELGFFAPLDTEFVPVYYALPARVNNTAIRDLIRRLAMMPAAQIAGEAVSRLGRRRAARVIVGQENEALRETLPWLSLAGIRTRRVGSLTAPSDRAPEECRVPAEFVAHLKADLASPLGEALNEIAEFDRTQSDAIVAIFLRHLAAGLVHLAARMPPLRQRVERLLPVPGSVLITNGLFGPAGMLVHRLCREQGARVIEFEHGVTAGIAALTDMKLGFGGSPPVEKLLVCSARSVRSFNGSAAEPAQAIGLPDQVRKTLRRPLQRRLARRALGLGPGPVVMHVSTLPYFGNHRPGLGAPTETSTFAIDRMLLEHVYPRLPHRVVFKQYPTQRFPFEPSYETVLKLSANVTLRKDEDFRYIRAAADVLVTMTPTSTLGWCVGAGVPLIWLDSRQINPLDGDDLRMAFAQSFLFVDLDSHDWPKRLLEILNRPLEAIRADWAARKAARESLYGEAITGPAGNVGRRAARVIAEILRRQEQDAVARLATEADA